ncbi:MAG: LCP family protein [Nocardioidaceae bacterium]
MPSGEDDPDATRPQPAPSPRKDSPEDGYSWLYDNGSATPRQSSTQRASSPGALPDPELPPPSWATARPAADRSSGSGAPPAGPPRTAAKSKRSGGSTWRRVLLAVVVLWIVFLVAVPVWAWTQIDKVDAEPNGDRPAEQAGTTYLLVGSDSRRGLDQEQREELATGDDTGGRGRTDTIMLMHVGSGPTLLMSIPRDSIVEIPGQGTTKINAAFSFGGPQLLVETIETNTGIRVDDYVEVGFGGFVNIVDGLGGVEICPETAIKDKDAGLDIAKGCQSAGGATALGYARSRHSYASQDLQRVQSQREVLGAIASAAKSPWTFLNPVRYFSVVSSTASSLRVGDNVGPLSLGRFAWNLSSAMGGGGLNCTVPIADTAVNWDEARSDEMFGLIIDDQTADIGKDLCTEDGLPAG